MEENYPHFLCSLLCDGDQDVCYGLFVSIIHFFSHVGVHLEVGIVLDYSFCIWNSGFS